MTTRLLLVRHGQTAENAKTIFQGQQGAGLDETGRAQVRRLALRLARTKIDHLVASDLERTQESARIVAEVTGHAIALDPGLREIDVGAWMGLAADEARERFPEEWAAWREGLDVRRGGGETYAELCDRITAALGRIARERQGETVLVVGHGAALRSFVSRVLGLPPQGRPSLSVMRNAAISTVHYEGDKPRLVAWNDTAHLEE